MSRAVDPETLLLELRAVYRDADALHAGIGCPGSTECCRFGLTGREPYVTSIELLALARALARRGGPLGRLRRALPITRAAADERVCPLLDRAGHCSVYADRPLGCRTYFCARAHGAPLPERAELRALVHRIQALAARHEQAGDRPRALTRALAT